MLHTKNKMHKACNTKTPKQPAYPLLSLRNRVLPMTEVPK